MKTASLPTMKSGKSFRKTCDSRRFDAQTAAFSRKAWSQNSAKIHVCGIFAWTFKKSRLGKDQRACFG